MVRWALASVLAVALVVGGVAPGTASASHGKAGAASGKVLKGKAGHKKGSHRKGGHKGHRHKKQS
jgi:hypothetical protein